MENLLTRHRNLSVLAAVLFAQLFGLAVQVRSNNPQQTRLIRIWAITAVTPLEKVIVYTQSSVYGVWHNYLYLRGVRQENRDLKAEIERLRLEQVRLSEDATQARRLQALLAFKNQYTIKTTAAQVIGSSGSEQSQSLYLDKGKRDGLDKGMAVITAAGVVGKILLVSDHTAQVLLINDQSSGLGAVLESARTPASDQGRVHGTVGGNRAGETVMKNVLLGEDVQPGDQVLTSGGDGIFPKGLPVGQVSKVSQADSFLQIRLRPAADLSRLEEVLVVTKLEEVAPPATDVAGGGQRAVDILAARLPGVPTKADSTADGPKKPQGPQTPVPGPANPPVPQNAAANPRNVGPLPVPRADAAANLRKISKPNNFKPAAVVGNSAGNGPQ